MTLGQKLDQRRFTAMSNRMAALVAFILGPESTMTTEPAITSLIITSDGIVLAAHSDDQFYNTVIGSASDLERNWATLLVAAELTPAETARANVLFITRVRDHRGDDVDRIGAAMAAGGLG